MFLNKWASNYSWNELNITYSWYLTMWKPFKRSENKVNVYSTFWFISIDSFPAGAAVSSRTVCQETLRRIDKKKCTEVETSTSDSLSTNCNVTSQQFDLQTCCEILKWLLRSNKEAVSPDTSSAPWWIMGLNLQRHLSWWCLIEFQTQQGSRRCWVGLDS